MTRYRGLIERYLRNSDSSTDAARQAAYEKIRSTLAAQLTRAGATIDAEAYKTAVADLEAAITAVEADFAGRPQTGPSPPPPPAPPSASKAAPRSSARALALAAVLAAIAGAALWWSPWNSAAPPAPAAAAVSPIDRQVAAARASFKQNRELVQTLAGRIEEMRKQRGSLPSTGGFVAWSTFVGQNAALSGVRLTPFNRGSFIVRTEGADYKILAVQTGDCVAALLDDTSFVDPPRSGGNLDCTFYGRWTTGAAAW